MRKILIMLSLIVGLASCGEEYSEFENIDFKTTGVKLSSQSRTYYYGETSSAGGEITFTATGKNADNGFLSQIKVGDFVYDVTDNDRQQPLPYTVCEKEWGKIEIMSVSPYTTRVVLNENKTGNSINYELTFGSAYKTSTILLTQLRSN